MAAVTKLHGFFTKKNKSLTLFVGLFCVLCLLLGCRKETDPGDVTILFWVALSEGSWENAKDYSTKGSDDLFSKEIKGVHVQIGKVVINYDHATVETYINREYSAKAEAFTTHLIRTPKNDIWKVDYQKTYQSMKTRELKSLLYTVKEIGEKAKIEIVVWFKNQGLSVLNWVKSFFKKD